ncbi:MAG TPA: signal peptidase I [Pirellulales bacterium]|nr:signal peptidase I [Pirellulales bacterium]
MLSFGILAIVFTLVFLATAWVVARAARAVGSPRGQFRWGLLIVVAGLGIGALSRLAASHPAGADPFLAAVFLVVLLGALFLSIKIIFRLAVVRTFAPFGAYLAMGLLQVGILMLTIRPYVLEAFRMPTGSMAPTLEPGDRFVVNKLISTRRWDLVAYETEDSDPIILCKRLIGLPGEKLRFEDGNVFVDNQPVTMPAVLAGRCHASLKGVPAGESRYADGETIALGSDEYFFIGDNVDASKDSRVGGPSHGRAIIGVVDLFYWPLAKVRIVR